MIIPDWAAPASVVAISTTRHGGQSQPPYNSLNLAQHVGDNRADVAANRATLQQLAAYKAEPAWLEQVHGKVVVNAAELTAETKADASIATNSNATCVVMTADCLPVLFCNKQGSGVAAAHAGWRGLAEGVLEATLQRLCHELSCPASDIMAWLGPAISANAFEVGDEVRERFISQHDVTAAFTESRPQHWLMDIYAVARKRLNVAGVADVSGGEFCTYSDADNFFSYRREGRCGRMATLIWLQDE